MTQTYADQLRAEAARLKPRSRMDDDTYLLKWLSKREQSYAKAWSGSNLGFHSCIYYKDFQPPPPGAHFFAEWGFEGRFQGTTGEWVEFQRDRVLMMIRGSVGYQLPRLKAAANAVGQLLDDAKANVVSILSAFLAFSDDAYLAALKDKVDRLTPSPTEAEVRAAFPRAFDTHVSRDAIAMGQGLRLAPHEEVRAEVESIRHPFKTCEELIKAACRAADHIDRLSQRPEASGDRQRGTRVFIGHGRSPQWRELKDFISERLGLPYDEFNRVPVAGTTNVDRLSQMLDNAAVAFLVLTAEDEKADGTVVARQNVVHKAGLFQGRLGFSRAIIMLEYGCDQFSNVDGLGQIRFPAGNVSAKFEDVRQVLEREGLVQP
ncbi:MAG: TIR domain-containing protein [Nitrospiraceae bacterium]